MTAIDALILALRTDIDQLLTLAEMETNGDRRAAVRLAVRVIRRTVDRHAEVAPEPETPNWPDAWDEFASCSRCGRRNPPVLATTESGLACHPSCVRGVLYRVECGAAFGTDLVVEVPAGIVEPGSVATWLAERLTVLTRESPLHEGRAVDWAVYLPDVTPDGPVEGFASLVVGFLPADRYPLIEVPRTGGAR